MELGKDNCKMRQEAFKFGDSVWLILEVWLYFNPELNTPSPDDWHI